MAVTNKPDGDLPVCGTEIHKAQLACLPLKRASSWAACLEEFLSLMEADSKTSRTHSCKARGNGTCLDSHHLGAEAGGS